MGYAVQQPPCFFLSDTVITYKAGHSCNFYGSQKKESTWSSWILESRVEWESPDGDGAGTGLESQTTVCPHPEGNQLPHATAEKAHQRVDSSVGPA